MRESSQVPLTFSARTAAASPHQMCGFSHRVSGLANAYTFCLLRSHHEDAEASDCEALDQTNTKATGNYPLTDRRVI